MGNETTVFVYDVFGLLVEEYSTVAPPETPTISYLTSDTLGSPRVTTKANGEVKARHDYLPFGEEIIGLSGRSTTQDYGRDDRVRQKFSGKERDNETKLDYFGARYYSDQYGRFTSVDPIKVTKERLYDVQRLNLYAYARNNPLKFVDKTGEDLEIAAKTLGEALKNYEIYRKGLDKVDQGAVSFFVGDGSNGYKKGVFYVLVDQKHQSNNAAFQNAQKVANDRTAVGRIQAVHHGDTYNIRIANQQTPGGPTVLTTIPQIFGVDFYFEGYTFFEYRPGTGVILPAYSDGNYTVFMINGDLSEPEQTVVMHHEVSHGAMGDMGRNPIAGSHPPVGPASVDTQIHSLEVEVANNAITNYDLVPQFGPQRPRNPKLGYIPRSPSTVIEY